MAEKKLSKDDEKKESLEKLEEIEKAYFDLMKAYFSCIAPLYLKKEYVFAKGLENIYSFSWDNVPGNDSEILLRFLKDNLYIDWAENAKIHKSDDKTICISKDENSANIKIDEKKKKAILKISDDRTYDLNVRKKHGKLNIIPKIKCGTWLDMQKEFYKKRLLGRQKGKTIDVFIKIFEPVSRIPYFIVYSIAYRIFRLRIKKRIDLLQEIFLSLLIAQNRNKIDLEIIKKFEIYSEDMNKISAQFTKHSFYAIITFVISLIPLFIVLKEYYISYNIIMIFLLLVYIFVIYLIPFIAIAYFVIRRGFSEAAIPEKEEKIFILIQEYLEFV